jgi:hypothetical protein
MILDFRQIDAEFCVCSGRYLLQKKAEDFSEHCATRSPSQPFTK